MKNLIFLLTVLMVTANIGNAQPWAKPIPAFNGTQDEAIAILRNSEFINIVRFAESEGPSGSVARFVVEVERIIPLDRQKQELITAQLLHIRNRNNWLLGWPMGYVPFIESEILDVLKDNFSTEEYEKLSERLSANLTTAASAYYYLVNVHANWGVHGFITIPSYIERIYDYFDI